MDCVWNNVYGKMYKSVVSKLCTDDDEIHISRPAVFYLLTQIIGFKFMNIGYTILVWVEILLENECLGVGQGDNK